MRWTMLLTMAGLTSVLVAGLTDASHDECGDPVFHKPLGTNDGTLWVNGWFGDPCIGASVQYRALRCDLPIHQDLGPATVATCRARDGAYEPDIAGAWVRLP